MFTCEVEAGKCDINFSNIFIKNILHTKIFKNVNEKILQNKVMFRFHQNKKND